MSANVDTIRDLAEQDYKWGFVTEIDEDRVPKGLNEEIDPADFGAEGGAGVHAGVAAEGVSPLVVDGAGRGRAEVGQHDHRAHRLPGHRVLLGAQAEAALSRASTQIDPEMLRTYEKLGIPLEEQKRLAGVAVDAVFDSVSVATTFKGKLAEMGVIFCSFSEAVQKHPGAGEEVPGHGGSVYRQFLCGAECGGVYRRLVCVRAQGRALPDGAVDVFPHQRRGDGAVRAHADCCRRGRVRELPGGLHGADSRHEPVARGGGGAGGAATTRRSSTRRCRTGIPATRKEEAGSTTS